jgi:hypothetical protein
MHRLLEPSDVNLKFLSRKATLPQSWRGMRRQCGVQVLSTETAVSGPWPEALRRAPCGGACYSVVSKSGCKLLARNLDSYKPKPLRGSA